MVSPTRRKTASQAGPKSIPSIPSKFETVFNAEAEANGFMRRTYRFDSNVTEVPGPGEYEARSKLAAAAPSQSKRGYGVGFASQTDRFSGKGGEEKQPGPGSYEARKDGRDWSEVPKNGPTAPFQPHNSRAITTKVAVAPGPGQYTKVDAKGVQYVPPNQVAAAFKSGSNRFKPLGAGRLATAPGPGTYEARGGVAEGFNTDMLAQSLPSAAFRSTTGRKFDQIQQQTREKGARAKRKPRGGPVGSGGGMPPTLMNFPINPTFGYTGEEATEQRMARSLEGRLMTRGTLAAAVGPGAYQPKLDPEYNMDNQRQSSFFSNMQLDRFGRSALSQYRQEDPTPGPGHYAVDDYLGKPPKATGAKPRASSTSGLELGNASSVARSHSSTPVRTPAAGGAGATTTGAADAGFGSTSPRFNSSGPASRRGKAPTKAKGTPQQLKGTAMPGPAYYNPKTAAPARSYHLNLARRWM